MQGQRTRSTAREARVLCGQLALTLALSLPFDLGCTSKPRSADAGATIAQAPADAGMTRGRRRRRRTRVRTASTQSPQIAQNTADPTGRTRTPTPQPTPTQATSAGLLEDDEPDPPRPRITETGPMLTENLGPPPSQTMDLTTTGGDGPMGLDESAVSRALNPLLGRLGNCAAATTDDDGRGPHGRVSIRVRVANSGRPIAARVSGGGGPAEFTTCVRRVIASARFSSFRGPEQIIGWGFDVD
ncbi:MAG: hypothetical protein JNK05_18630 [Myxococcales bacterium]|nr:hypothetical protein [Myxococcales bacterium]